MSIEMAELTVDPTTLFVVTVCEFLSGNIATPFPKRVDETLGYLRVEGTIARIVDDDGLEVARANAVYEVSDDRAERGFEAIFIDGWLPGRAGAPMIWGRLILR